MERASPGGRRRRRERKKLSVFATANFIAPLGATHGRAHVARLQAQCETVRAQPIEMPRRDLSPLDLEAWANYARHVALLPGRAAPALSPNPPIPPVPARPPSPPLSRHSRVAAPEILVGERPTGIDNGSWTRLQAGRLRPDRTLDLHGRTAQHAFHALHAFLHQASAERLRCVEIITGRGSGANGGVIRRELPLWLNLPSLRSMVLAGVHPHPVNVGAVRLLLRRPR